MKENEGAKYRDDGISLYDVGKYDEALVFFSKGFEAGDALSAFYIGCIYDFGLLGETDAAKAIQYYKYAADHDCRQASFNLAITYLENNGCVDVDNVIRYFKKAASLGEVDAYVKLGELYSNGKYLTKDLKRSFEYYFQSANRNDAHSKNILGYLYLQGKGVGVDYRDPLTIRLQASNICGGAPLYC